MNEPTSLIHNIRLTERPVLLGEKHNQYVFRVDPRANKLQNQAGHQEIFGKKVVLVIPPNTPGKKNGTAEPISVGARIGRRRS